MSYVHRMTTWRSLAAGLIALTVTTGAVRGEQDPSKSADADKSQERSEPVVRSFGEEGGFRTETSTKTEGKLTAEHLRQASLLVAEVFQHIKEAVDAIDADDSERARDQVNKGREAIRAIRALLPRTAFHIKTTSPDGKVVYQDEREAQPDRIPLYEGIMHAQTLAPILAARRNAMEVAGLQVVESEVISTEVIADIGAIDGGLSRAAKALEQGKSEDASKALGAALIRGLSLRYSKDDSPLIAARDALWLARRSLEENNAAQAQANLLAAKRRLETYRDVLPEGQRQAVQQMLDEVERLEAQLRQEGNRVASRDERHSQGNLITRWWDRVNEWLH
ncbi:YfdX family protein [Paludisphaera soli]|uniref:YfdX family protein n=1 Tax=Paludisphaera soli TaxID=2712865 RepID=UPI0013EDDB5C|nr:YfdX family protein [Paludisphaera soli]